MVQQVQVLWLEEQWLKAVRCKEPLGDQALRTLRRIATAALEQWTLLGYLPPPGWPVQSVDRNMVWPVWLRVQWLEVVRCKRPLGDQAQWILGRMATVAVERWAPLER